MRLEAPVALLMLLNRYSEAGPKSNTRSNDWPFFVLVEENDLFYKGDKLGLYSYLLLLVTSVFFLLLLHLQK